MPLTGLADLLSVASRYREFPILLETYRECLRDVFDVPGLRDVLRQIQRQQLRVHTADSAVASPFTTVCVIVAGSFDDNCRPSMLVL